VSGAEGLLAAFVAGLGPASIPAEKADRVRQHIVDALACGIAGRSAEGRDAMAAVAATTFGPGDSTVFVGDPLAAGGAVLLNGFQIAAPTLGDVHRETLTHVLPEVLPAALVSAEIHGGSGGDVLAAVAAGMEVTVRVAQALDVPAYRERAWHNPGIAGSIGAACAAARAARLPAGRVALAIGHAASQAAGTFVALGTSGVKVHQARGGLAGFLAAELAGAGIDASVESLTAERGGLLATYADGGAPDGLASDLGGRWELQGVALRRWPGASSVQPIIDAVLALRGHLPLAAAGGSPLGLVDSVLVELPPRAYALNGASAWDTQLAALQSARWTATVALDEGDVWLDQTSDAARADPRLTTFAGGRVRVADDSSLAATGARITLFTKAGERLVHQSDIPPGDPRRPLDWSDIRAKLRRAGTDACLDDRAPAIAEAIDRLEALPSIRALSALLRRADPP
jgi:2-methylcitrate dehydratase PrpD